MVGQGELADDEARAYLQARLAAYARGLVASLAGLVALLYALYALYPEIEPRNTRWILLGWDAGVVGIAIIWRVVLVRGPQPERLLHAIDLAFAACTGFAFGCSAYFSPELHASAYTSLLLFVFVLFARAVVVPASARRTAIVSTMSFLPLIAAAIGLALTDVPEHPLDLPGPAYVLGALALTTIATVLATMGSQVMNGLREQVSRSRQLGQYTLERRIGQGGMGVVYRARHVLLRRPTAIKLLAADQVGAEALARFEREVQHTSQLTHPNTVAVFDYGRSADGRFYYAMEYIDGVDLEQLVKRDGPQPPGRVVHILAQVCGALQEAHDRGIIHRDIKPANIIVCERGVVPDVAKVVDFGLVTEIAGDVHTASPLLGTPGYLAPEAVTAPELVGPAADQYALGAVAYYLLTGRRVFEGATALEICMKHVTDAPPPLDATPPQLAAAILRALAKQPQDRHTSAGAFADALRAADPGTWATADARGWWAARAAAERSGHAQPVATTITLAPRSAANAADDKDAPPIRTLAPRPATPPRRDGGESITVTLEGRT